MFDVVIPFPRMQVAVKTRDGFVSEILYLPPSVAPKPPQTLLGERAAQQLERAPLSQWQAMGITRVSGRAFPRAGDVGRLYMPAGASGP